MFEHDCLDAGCFGCLICMCFVFLCLHLFSAIEHVSHGKVLWKYAHCYYYYCYYYYCHNHNHHHHYCYYIIMQQIMFLWLAGQPTILHGKNFIVGHNTQRGGGRWGVGGSMLRDTHRFQTFIPSYASARLPQMFRLASGAISKLSGVKWEASGVKEGVGEVCVCVWCLLTSVMVFW